ncbi:hypothetical protein HDE_13181 [Halotydeus destructor]|nr:hypothetical protein HDE_13181 [Halotydeus destructor]
MFTPAELNYLTNCMIKGDKVAVQQFLEKKPELDIDEEFEFTFKQLNRPFVFEKLKNVLNTDICKIRLIHLAVMTDDVKTIQLLINNYAAETSTYMLTPKRTGWGQSWSLSGTRLAPALTPLHLAALLNHEMSAICLLKAGALAFIKDPFMKRNALDIALDEKNFAVLDAMLSFPLDTSKVPFKCRRSIRSILIDGRAVIAGNWLTVKKFISLYPDAIDADDNTGTVIEALINTMAMDVQESECVLAQLHDKGYNFGRRLGLFRDTLLHLAAACRIPRLVKFLIQTGIDVNAVNSRQETALHHLMFYGTDHCSATNDTFTTLISLKADHKLRSRSGLNAFEAAVVHGNNALVETFIDSDYQETAINGSTPLQFYVQRGIITSSTLSCFSRKGHSFNMADAQGNFLIHLLLARLYWQSDSTRFRCIYDIGCLVSSGAALDVINGQGQTPLLTALKRNLHLDIVKALITNFKSKDSIPRADKNGESALDVALENLSATSDEVVKCLVSAGTTPRIGHLRKILGAADDHLHVLVALLSEDGLVNEIKVSYPSLLIDVLKRKEPKRNHLLIPLIGKLLCLYQLDINHECDNMTVIHFLVKACCPTISRKNHEKVLEYILKLPELDLNIETDVTSHNSEWCGFKLTPFEYAVYLESHYLVKKMFDKDRTNIDPDKLLKLCRQASATKMIPILNFLSSEGYYQIALDYLAAINTSSSRLSYSEKKEIENFKNYINNQHVDHVRDECKNYDQVRSLQLLSAIKVSQTVDYNDTLNIANSQVLPKEVVEALTNKYEDTDWN